MYRESQRLHPRRAAVVWMALCWTLFALPVYGGGQALVAGRLGGKGAKLALQVLPLSFWRVREIVVSLGFPAAPDPGYANYNWAVVRTQALAALPTASYRDLVADPSVLVGLRGLPLAWLGVAYGPIIRLAYAALLLLLLAGAYLLWRDAHSGARGRMIEVLALGVLLSNLWGAVCSVFLLHSAGVVTLLSGNPFQLVPLVCLLAMELVPDDLDPFGAYLDGSRQEGGWSVTKARMTHGGHRACRRGFRPCALDGRGRTHLLADNDT